MVLKTIIFKRLILQSKYDQLGLRKQFVPTLNLKRTNHKINVNLYYILKLSDQNIMKYLYFISYIIYYLQR